MFTRNDFTLEQKVYFGTANGEKTLGQIKKLNLAKAKVVTLEDRGNGRGSSPGTVWSVPYGLLKPADPAAKPGEPMAVAPPPPLVYSPYRHVDNLILEAMSCIYAGMSPENLHCDGEASMSHVRNKMAEYNRQLKGLQMALGRSVSDSEVYAWNLSKIKFERERQAAAAV
jgi:hypothetical protein